MQDLPQFAEMPESVRNIMKASIDQARKAFDTFISASQKTMAGFEGASNPTTDGLKQLNDKIAEFTRMNAEANFKFAMKLADAKQFSDVLEMQNSHARELMDTFARQLEELRELTTTVVKQSAQNVTANMPNMPGMPGSGQ
jgi:phasin